MIRAIKRLNLLLSNTVNPRKLQARREYTDSGAKKRVQCYGNDIHI